MDRIQLITLLLGSAAIGALVSALMTMLTQWQDRKARQRELIFSKSVEMANAELDRQVKIIEMTNDSRALFPTVVTARWYHRQLTRLFEEGKIADDLENEFNDYINKAHKDL